MSFYKILEKYRKLSFSEHDKGSRFERLIQAYLYTDPKYTHLTKIWLWADFPYRSDFGSHDIGIDLVALTAEGEYWAIQSKCYREEARISKEEVDTFLSTSGRSFKDNTGERIKFSHRLWVSTTNSWSSKAEETLQNQDPPVTRINLSDLIEAPVDWAKIDDGIFGDKARTTKKELRQHQQDALHRTIEYFKSNERGKLIMACGTGKTFTSLRIAEEQTQSRGSILFLVPSIALLGQTLREWTADARENINAIAVCSDVEVAKEKKKNSDAETYSVVDLAMPASTDVDQILKQFELFEMTKKTGMTVVFSTYQSIDVIAKAQKRLEGIGSKYEKFDLVICDEAHRTTGVTLANEDESSFVKIHNNDFIHADKRLYMTATPRLYGEDSKRKAEESSAAIASMDKEEQYGKEIYRIGFGAAVEKGLLSDYKVLILTLSESDVTPEVQRVLANTEQEIVNMDDVSKLVGCINAMSKQIISDDGSVNVNDPEPMRRAVAFVPNIKASRKITNTFNEIADTYFESVPDRKQQTLVKLQSQHIDGTMSATERDKLMSWLKEEPKSNQESRILTNVRCLSEGVDVPSLDAVMFLSARNSQVDVVQSVGRVMRTSPGKKYGYIIIPIVVPNDVSPEDALNDNERYKVVWTVLNALRAHDDRFNATVNKIELNKKRPDQILIGRPDPDGDGDPFNDPTGSKSSLAKAQQTAFHFNELQTAIYAKMVEKVGERKYWENWAKDIAEIAERHITRITKIVDEDDDAHMAFRRFLKGLQQNINPSVTEHQAVEMLSQHIITKPIFEALFEGYSFVQNNAVSQSMQAILNTIEQQTVDATEAEKLEAFYQSVRRRAAGVDNAEGKQKIILELYDKFFKAGFPKMVEQLGIVYTPIEVVDFIIHSVNDVLKKEFGRSLSDENVNILDPFTGTGTFVTRLLQSGVIEPKDLERKYKHEIFANEIVLLAYYIAAVNIENAYHDLLQKETYEGFEGIVLTDTFQLSENYNAKIFSDTLAENSERMERQRLAPLRVIIGNPPYSGGQKSANDNAQNQKYSNLDARIASTYAASTKATNKNSLYDSYIRAFRWATDRLDDEGGVVGFVTSGSWLDGKAHDGLRKSLQKEFNSIYVFNLRGDQYTEGEISRMEGGKIFGSGSRSPIAITILVKNPNKSPSAGNISYRDIGDYLSKEDKLMYIKQIGSVVGAEFTPTLLSPNSHADWIGQRTEVFSTLIPLIGKEVAGAFFEMNINCRGLETARDAWVYNSSTPVLTENVRGTIDFFNRTVKTYSSTKIISEKIYDSTKISWSRSLLNDVKRLKTKTFNETRIFEATYRPFFKQKVYFSRELNNVISKMANYFPDHVQENLLICISGLGGTKAASCLITNNIADLNLLDAGTQCLPLYYYEEKSNASPLFDNSSHDGYIRHDAISNFILEKAQRQYRDPNIIKEDIFYYVYGILHSPDYRYAFANDLKKVSPRLPLIEGADNFWIFSKSGRQLAQLHLNYEDIDPYSGVRVMGTQYGNYSIGKMKFVKKGQRDTIIFNNQITVENIPEKAYEYVVNGKSAIEWILDRYQIKKDKASGIVNDPNDWANETKNPRYILDLLLSVINVSVQTVDIINNLPKLTFEQKAND